MAQSKREPGRTKSGLENPLLKKQPEAPRKKTKKTKRRTKKAPTKAAPEKPKPAAPKTKTEATKGRTARAPRKQTATSRTKAARELDQNLSKVLEKMKHPLNYPVQMTHPCNCIHSGLFMLDLILCGGIRNGRMYTFVGEPSSGKSSVLQEVLSAAQRQGVRIFHFDMERSSARQYMVRQGITPDETYRLKDGSRGYYYLQPDTGEEFYRMAVRLLSSLPLCEDANKPPTTILLVDSYEVMESEAVTEDKNPIGAYARMHSMWQKKLVGRLSKHGAALVATNQTRTSGIGNFMGPNTEDDAGGYALKFYADARVFMRTRPEGKPEPTGKGIAPGDNMPKAARFGTFKTKKNKMSDPSKEEPYRLVIGLGFDRLYDRLAFLVSTGEIKREQNRFIIAGKKLPYKTARNVMRKARWRERCEELVRKMSTYEAYFKDADKVEVWDED